AVRVKERGAPETNVVSLAGIVSHRLFKRQIFFTSPEVKVADRGIGIRTLEYSRFGDFETAAQRERVGGIPFGRQHGSLQLIFRADQGNIDGTARMVITGKREARNIIERGMPMCIANPYGGHDKVRTNQVYEKQCEDQRGHTLEANAPWRRWWR